MISSELLGSVFGSVVTLVVASPALAEWWQSRRARKRQLYKFTYVKIVHLTNRAAGGPPVYVAHVPRLGAAGKVDVYDEYHYFRLNVFHRAQDDCSVTDRSSGVVDLQILHPFAQQLAFADEGAQRIPGFISQEIPRKTSVLFTRSVYYNGLQQGNEDIATKLDYDTDEVRMLVDFSSLPDFHGILDPNRDPRGTRRGGDGRPEAVGVDEISPGIYSICVRGGKKGEVLRIDFPFVWSARQAAAV